MFVPAARSASPVAGWVTAPLQLADLDRVLAIERACFTCPWEAADFRRCAQDCRAVALEARLSSELVGYAVGRVDGIGLHLVNLAIAPAHQRRGCARRLLRDLMERAVDSGCMTCRLEVRGGNAAARALYLGMGFRQAGVRMSYYTKPVEDAIVLDADLSPFVE